MQIWFWKHKDSDFSLLTNGADDVLLWYLQFKRQVCTRVCSVFIIYLTKLPSFSNVRFAYYSHSGRQLSLNFIREKYALW